jgi:hypothetical protein
MASFRSPLPLVGLAAALCAGFPATQALGAPAGEEHKEEKKVDPAVQKHFDLGNELYQEQRFGDALLEYDEAYRLSHNYKILFNRGQCLVMLRREPEAIEAFEQYLAGGGDEIAADRRSQVDLDLVKLRQRLGSIVLEAAPSGCEVTIDGRKVGTTPLAKPILVGVGTHELSVRPASGRPYVKKLDVIGGAQITDKVEMPKDPPKAPAPGLIAPAFALSMQLGLSAPLTVVSRGSLPALGMLELAGALRPHPLYELGFFIGGATGKYQLNDGYAATAGVESGAQYGYGMGGIRGRLHLLRDPYFSGWVGLDFGVWRESGKFTSSKPGKNDFEYLAISPVGALGLGIDFPLARTWAIGAAARFLVANAANNNRTACGNNCDGGFPGSSGSSAVRGFLEVGARLSFAIPYGE